MISRGLAIEPVKFSKGEQVFESVHPYLNDTDLKWTICIPGAEELVVVFDRQTRTEQSYDYLQFSDSTSSTVYGTYSGASLSTWPGAEDGSPPLVIPGDTCLVHFYADGYTNGISYRPTEESNQQCLNNVFLYRLGVQVYG